MNPIRNIITRNVEMLFGDSSVSGIYSVKFVDEETVNPRYILRIGFKRIDREVVETIWNDFCESFDDPTYFIQSPRYANDFPEIDFRANALKQKKTNEAVNK